MHNIFCKNCDLGNFPAWFKEQIEKNLSSVGNLSEFVQIWIIKSYLADLPNENDTIKFIYFKKFDEKFTKTISDFCSEMKQINDRAKYSISGFGDVKIFVLFNFSDKNSGENAIYGKNSEQDTPNLNISPINPKYKFSQMVLNEKVKSDLQNCVLLVKNMAKIYDEWGFSEIDPVRKSVINFFGPAGTGKTMSAHALANEIGKKILAVNYAEIESKFVGEAPKNLISAFEIAKNEDAVLFFDEADSFLGKRITSVSSSSDQAVNSLRSQMLMLLENYEIIVIFATNLNENYDKAFNSRIITNIKFELPDNNLRKEAILRLMPEKAPVDSEILQDETLIEKLVNLSDGFSYRDLKNAILNVLVKSCENGSVTKDILIEIFESKKLEIEPNKNSIDKTEKVIKKKISTKNYRVVKNRKVGNE